MRGLLALLFAVSLSFSAVVVVNSQNGMDLVSAAYYAVNTGEKVVFVPPSFSEAIVYGKIGWNGEVLLIQSESAPMLPGMANELRNRGNTVETLVSSEPYATNLLLAERSGAEKFILVDPIYGYNTVSALAYAKLNGMYLLFADKETKDDVVYFLREKRPSDILLYGYVDGEVKDALDGNGLRYWEINTGDKFDDNMELVELYLAQNPSKKQVILSDGNAFEDTIVAGDDPVVLISPVVPVSVYNFMKEKAAGGSITVGLVVDREYAQTAYNLKESINDELGRKALHVLVKFGQNVPAAGSGLFDVDLFPVRGPILGLAISGVEYNTGTRELEIAYENTGNAPEYVTSRIMVYVDGAYVGTVGDEEPFAIEKSQRIGRAYPIEVESGQIAANITALFGSSRKSHENGIVASLNAGRVEFTDRSVLSISDFTEDGEDLFVTYSNDGNVSAYFRADASVRKEGRSTNIEDDRLYKLDPGEAKMVKFPGVLKGALGITAGADYGAREAFLQNRIEREYVPSGFDYTLLLIGLVALLLIVAAYLFVTRKKEK